jgi:hypothetical protein
MLSAVEWGLVFSLFWTSAGSAGVAPATLAERYFFPASGEFRVFEVRRPFSPVPSRSDPRENREILVELNPGSGAVRAMRPVPPVFRLFLADIDHHGDPELIIGVVKQTPIGPRRRVFVYRPEGGQIKPVWHGSRLSFVLLDFTLIATPERHLLVSRESHNGSIHHGRYAWDDFGFRPVTIQSEVNE